MKELVHDARESRAPRNGSTGPWVAGLPSRSASVVHRLIKPRSLVLASAIIVICYLVAGPLIYLGWGSFFTDAGFTLDSFRRAYSDPQAVEMVRNSLLYALGSTALAVVTGTLLAYLFTRTNAPFKGLLFAGALLPTFLPAMLYAPAWIFLASPNGGIIGSVTEALLGAAPFNIYSIWGMIWVEGLHLAPVAFLLMVAAFRLMDPALEESAQDSGAGRLTVLLRITLPLVRPALASAVVVVLTLALGSFDVPLFIGEPGGVFVFTSRIYFLLNLYPVDLGAAGALGVSLLGIAFGTSLLLRLGSKDRAGYQTVTGKGFRPRPIPLGRARGAVGACVLVYLCVAVVAPLGSLLYASLLSFYQEPALVSGDSFTWSNYGSVLTSSATSTALMNSVLVGVASVLVILLVSVPAVWYVTRSTGRLRWLVEGITFLPLIIPGLVLGLAVSFVYLRSPVPIYGTIWILIIAYSTRFLPYGMRYVGASMSQIGKDLEESAYSCGATWWQAFCRIVVPLASPGIVSGGIYILIVSFQELGASVLLVSPGTNVLSVVIYNQFQEGDLTELAATGIVMVCVLLVLVLVGYKVGSRAGIRLG